MKRRNIASMFQTNITKELSKCFVFAIRGTSGKGN